MSNPTPSPDPIRRCTARKRDGERCGQPAVRGATVCRMHGGSAPQVRRAAKLRLLDLVDPAIATLAREMTNQDARAADRIRAAEAVLDRAGHPRQMQVTGEDVKDLLLQRLLQLREQALAERDSVVDQARQIIDGEVIEPGPDDGQNRESSKSPLRDEDSPGGTDTHPPPF